MENKFLIVRNISLLFLFLIFQLTLFAEDIQPLGLQSGRYVINPGGKKDIRAFCLDQFILTEEGNVYDKIITTNENKITIGRNSISTQEAIDQGKISLVFTRTGANGEMYITITNKTKQQIVFIVDADGMALSTKESANELKSIGPLLQAIPAPGIQRQEYIWFSHGYKEYIENYRKILTDLGIVGSDPDFPIGEYLKNRNTFLEKNGVTNKTLVQDYNPYGGVKEVYDYDLMNLLDLKIRIKNLTDETGHLCYILRYQQKGNKAFYYVDKGDVECFVSEDLVAIANYIANPEIKTVVGFDEKFPSVKRDALMFNLSGKNSIGVEITRQNLKVMPQLLDPTAIIESVSEIAKIDYLNIFEFDVKFDKIKEDEKLNITCENKGYLNKMRGWFMKLIGKQTDKTMAETISDAQKVANKAFPKSRIRAEVELKSSSIRVTRSEIFELLLKDSKVWYAYFPGNN